MEAVTPEKFLRHVFGPIGQKRDSKEIFLARELGGVVEKHRAVSVTLKFLLNHEVLEQDHEAAFRSANGEKEIDHADDHAVTPKHENASTTRLFKNQSQTSELFVFVGTKIAFLGEEVAEHLG